MCDCPKNVTIASIQSEMVMCSKEAKKEMKRRRNEKGCEKKTSMKKSNESTKLPEDMSSEGTQLRVLLKC